MSRPVTKAVEVRVSGPLAPFAAGFKASLLHAGYTPLTAVVQLRLMVHLSRWLAANDMSATDLTQARISEYLSLRRAAGYAGLFTRRALDPLLDFLITQGVAPQEPSTPPRSPVAELLASFEKHLLTERTLAGVTTSAYLSRAARFVDQYAPGGRVETLTTADVTDAVTKECARVSTGGVQYFVAALRAFLRYCHLHGLTDKDLSAAALAVTGRRSWLLPKGLTAAQTAALLRSCDRRTAIGRRDYAILLILLRLGLRAGEVSALRLEDIDWRAADLLVRGKGRRVDRLPLPMLAKPSPATCAWPDLSRPAAKCS